MPVDTPEDPTACRPDGPSDEALTEVVAAAIAVTLAGLAFWRPEGTVMGLGVFLFVQSALVRLGSLPEGLTTALSRADEIVLAALFVRTLAVWFLTRRPALPKALWAMVAFAAVGVVSALANGVGFAGMGLGIFLAAKSGLWLFVGHSLRINTRILAWYAYFIGALFVGVVAIAVLQLLGVPMPWETTPRAGVFAATSIWNQHTAFGGALVVGVALSVAAFRMPGEALGAAVLFGASGLGILLSTVRRVLGSLAVAFVVLLLAVPRRGLSPMRPVLNVLRRPVILAVLLAALGIGAVTIVPRMVTLATYTWDKYVVELTSRDRYSLYVGALRLVERSPVVGRGPATYGSYASVVVDSPAYREVGFNRRHAAMVVGGQLGSLLAEYGILGFAAFATFLALVVRALWPISRGTGGTIQAGLAAGGILMVSDMVVESVINPVFSNSFITFFAFTGIGVAMTLHARTEEDPRAGAWTSSLVSPRLRALAIGGAVLLLLVLVATAAVAGGQ